MAGSWVDVPPQPHSLVINTGRLLSRWTNNVFPATFHRVQNNPGSDRYSIPLFFGTNFHTVIKPLDCCLSSESGSGGSSADGSASGGLEPVVCGDYITEGYAWQVSHPHLEPSPDPHLIPHLIPHIILAGRRQCGWGDGSGRGCGGRRGLRGARCRTTGAAREDMRSDEGGIVMFGAV